MELTWTDANGASKRIVFDSTISENLEHRAVATTHPLESGAKVSDHVIREQDRLQFEVVVSNTPIRTPETQNRQVSGSLSNVSLGVTTRNQITRGATDSARSVLEQTSQQMQARALQFSGAFNRVQDVYTELLGLLDSGLTCTVTTTLRTYPNCVLEAIQAPRDVETANAPIFTLDFIQITYAQSQTVEAPAPRQPRGSRQVNRGAQAAQEATDEQTIDAASLAYEGARALGLVQ